MQRRLFWRERRRRSVSTPTNTSCLFVLINDWRGGKRWRAFRLPRRRIHRETKRGNPRKITESRVNRNATGLCCHTWARNHKMCLVPTWILRLRQIEAFECIEPFLSLVAAAFTGTHHDIFPQRVFPHSFHRTLLFFLDSLHDLPTGLFSPSGEKINNINKPERSCASFQILKAV